MQIFSGLVQACWSQQQIWNAGEKRQTGETMRTFLSSAFSQCKSESSCNSITHIGAQRANTLPLTSCAMTQKSSLHKSPDYPYVAEIDLYVWESNTLKSLSAQSAGRGFCTSSLKRSEDDSCRRTRNETQVHSKSNPICTLLKAICNNVY